MGWNVSLSLIRSQLFNLILRKATAAVVLCYVDERKLGELYFYIGEI